MSSSITSSTFHKLLFELQQKIEYRLGFICMVLVSQNSIWRTSYCPKNLFRKISQNGLKPRLEMERKKLTSRSTLFCRLHNTVTWFLRFGTWLLHAERGNSTCLCIVRNFPHCPAFILYLPPYVLHTLQTNFFSPTLSLSSLCRICGPLREYISSLLFSSSRRHQEHYGLDTDPANHGDLRQTANIMAIVLCLRKWP